MESELKKIYDLINELQNSSSPDRVSEIRVQLASWKAWVGEKKTAAEMAFNIELNRVMAAFDLPAAKALIQVKAGEKYRIYAKILQLYNDMKTVIASAQDRLDTLRDERRTY